MKQSTIIPHALEAQYDSVFHRVAGVVAAARQSAARSVNALMTGAYWTIGRHIVEFEQSGEERAAYGANLIEKLATGMTQRYGRGFSRQNLWQMEGRFPQGRYVLGMRYTHVDPSTNEGTFRER